MPVQAAIDYAHEHGSPPGDVEIDREPPFAGAPDFIELVTLPLLGNGQTDISGINVRVHGGWTVDSVELEFDAHWSHTLDYEVRVIGLSEPYDFPQNRVHATLRGTRGNVTAQWTAYGLSSYRTEGGRFGSWMGNDFSLRWKDAFGMQGTDVVGGILNIGDRSPPIDLSDPDYPDEGLDSIRGRTLFLTLKKSW